MQRQTGINVYVCMKMKTNIYIYISMWWGPIFIYDIRCIHCVGSTLYMTPCPVSMARPWYPPPFVYPAPEFAGVVAVVVVIVVRSSSFTNTQLPNLSASSLQKETTRKINIEPENDGLEDDVPFPGVYSQVSC